MKKRAVPRRFMLALVAAFLVAAAAAPSANATWNQLYCAGAAAPYPYFLCESSGLHSLYYNEAFTTSYSQLVCEYMWNAHNGVIRGDYVGCDYGVTERTWNRPRNAWYNAKGYNAMGYSILLSAFTTT